jgi:Arc/MetJ-type ribon-helix-helix transcriptional regulator
MHIRDNYFKMYRWRSHYVKTWSETYTPVEFQQCFHFWETHGVTSGRFPNISELITKYHTKLTQKEQHRYTSTLVLVATASISEPSPSELVKESISEVKWSTRRGGKVACVRRYLYTCLLDYAKWATHYGLHQYKVNLYWVARFLKS